ncbi:MAG TPA: hypothetical protein VD997_11150 [Phycisphaerales bacterium]|nr:hypothetical protein [Phycisphaerales bacterium]
MTEFPGRGRVAAGLSVLLLAAGAAQSATTLAVQVSLAGQENWQTSLNAFPGASVDVRVLVSYQGSAAPLGFAFTSYQPTLSNWHATDTLGPLVNNGWGGQQTTPIGAVQDAPGQYGRIIPYAFSNIPENNRVIGHINTVSGTTYLRVAQRQVTSWFGGTGNTSGGSGVTAWQLSDQGRTASTPAFSPALVNVTLFKFKVQLSSTEVGRTLHVDIPAAGISNGRNNGQPYVAWFQSMSEPVGSLLEVPSVVTASINLLPSPGTLLLLAPLAVVQRRRRG